MARCFGGPVTQDSHEWSRELLDSRREGEHAMPAHETLAASRARDPVASAIGTALHRALELLDPSQGAERALATMQETAEHALGCSTLAAAALAQARERSRQLVERFVAGELFRRLERIAPHIVARELSVLLLPPAGESGPTGYVSGRIDLVYVDPETLEPVIADYKTGRAEAEQGIQEAATRHAAQGAQYVRALRAALSLPRDPRFELWFLNAGRIEPVA
jgi:ATP-dependent exoDNAse (exonuclease V) beta subunit